MTRIRDSSSQGCHPCTCMTVELSGPDVWTIPLGVTWRHSELLGHCRQYNKLLTTLCRVQEAVQATLPTLPQPQKQQQQSAPTMRHSETGFGAGDTTEHNGAIRDHGHHEPATVNTSAPANVIPRVTPLSPPLYVTDEGELARRVGPAGPPLPGQQSPARQLQEAGQQGAVLSPASLGALEEALRQRLLTPFLQDMQHVLGIQAQQRQHVPVKAFQTRRLSRSAKPSKSARSPKGRSFARASKTTKRGKSRSRTRQRGISKRLYPGKQQTLDPHGSERSRSRSRSRSNSSRNSALPPRAAAVLAAFARHLSGSAVPSSPPRPSGAFGEPTLSATLHRTPPGKFEQPDTTVTLQIEG